MITAAGQRQRWQSGCFLPAQMLRVTAGARIASEFLVPGARHTIKNHMSAARRINLPNLEAPTQIPCDRPRGRRGSKSGAAARARNTVHDASPIPQEFAPPGTAGSTAACGSQRPAPHTPNRGRLPAGPVRCRAVCERSRSAADAERD